MSTNVTTDATTATGEEPGANDRQSTPTHNPTDPTREPATALLEREITDEADTTREEDLSDLDLGPVMVGDIPRVAKSVAVRKLADALIAQGHSEGAARAIARAVTRPEEVRRRLALPDEDRVPGGTVLTVKATVWSAAVSTFPGNMREAESRRYPFAVGDGAATPLPSLHSANGSDTELTLDAPSREAVVASLKESAAYLKDNNNWEPSVRVHGVLREVLSVPARFVHGDGSRAAHILVTADGSSRGASTHRILRVDPEDLVYGFPDDDQAWRSHLGRTLQGSSLPAEDLTTEQAEQIRAATMPAKIVLGFRPDEGQAITLGDAIQFIVGLTHVEPPRGWEKGSQLDAQAEAVLEDLRRLGRISLEEADYYAGLLTPASAAGHGFSAHADERAAEILNVVLRASNRKIVSGAIRRVTARAQARVSAIVPVGAELALRGWAPRADRRSRAKVDGVRDALQRMFNTASVHKQEWRISHRTPEALLRAALVELETDGEPGPAARELGVLGGWWLVVSGFMKREVQRSPNKSALGVVLETLIRNRHGLRLLADALIQTRRGQPVRAVNAEGQPIDHLDDLANFSDRDRTDPYYEDHGTDDWLRWTFMVSPEPEPDEPLDTERTTTPDSQLDQAKTIVVRAVERLEEALEEVRSIEGYTLQRLIDERGWPTETVRDLVRRLDDATDALRKWGWTWEQTSSARAPRNPPCPDSVS